MLLFICFCCFRCCCCCFCYLLPMLILHDMHMYSRNRCCFNTATEWIIVTESDAIEYPYVGLKLLNFSHLYQWLKTDWVYRHRVTGPLPDKRIHLYLLRWCWFGRRAGEQTVHICRRHAKMRGRGNGSRHYLIILTGKHQTKRSMDASSRHGWR